WSNDSNDDGKISLKYDSSPSLFRSISFKVSDEKIIILDGESIYDMNQKPCSIIKHDYKMKGNRDAKYDFLSNGDIVAYHKRAISIYSSDGRKRKAEHKLNKEDKIFDGVINDKLLVFVDNNLFILDLLQLSKIHYLKEKEKIMLKFSKNITVININGTLYIYSNNNNIYVPIGVIDHSTLVQDFGIIHDDKDEYIITISNDDISIHSWKKKLKKNTNINELYTAFKSENDPNIDFNDRFVHIEFKDNKAYLYCYYNNNQWITKIYILL
ncbi:12807_t:CDS:2, partial [Rhizophagus irregularis]